METAYYSKIMDGMLDRKDPVAYKDLMQMLADIETNGAAFVDSVGGTRIDYDPDAFKLAHDYSLKLRNACTMLLKAGNDTYGSEYEELAQILNSTLKFDSPFDFDAFMRFIEKDRSPGSRFWMPRRKHLLPVAKKLQLMEENKLDELFISFPPRVGKTTLVMFFVLWVILRDSERSNLYCSYSDGVVSVFYNGLLEILNDPYTYAWQEAFPKSRIASTNARDLLLNMDRKKRYASFTGRSLYGTLNGACDCNGYEIADDLISGIEEAMNKDRLDSAWLKVDNNYLPRGKEGSKRLWIGTRWATADMQSRRVDLLENDERFRNVRWEAMNIPALNEQDESNFEYAYGVGFSSEYYQQRRASFERNSDMASWNAQYMGVPIDRSGSVFEPQDMRFFNGVLPKTVEPDRVFMAIDPAWGGGDYTAAPVCVQYGDDIYVVDVVYTNEDKRKSQPAIVDAVMRHRVQAIMVEATRVTASFAEDIDKMLREKKYKVNVQHSVKNWTFTGKQQRIFDKAPDIREHMVFLESGKRSKRYEQFMNSVYAFKIGDTNKHHHDDACDSLAMAICMVYFGGGARMTVSRRVW